MALHIFEDGTNTWLAWFHNEAENPETLMGRADVFGVVGPVPPLGTPPEAITLEGDEVVIDSEAAETITKDLRAAQELVPVVEPIMDLCLGLVVGLFRELAANHDLVISAGTDAFLTSIENNYLPHSVVQSSGDLTRLLAAKLRAAQLRGE
jgi:hypothetical protein